MRQLKINNQYFTQKRISQGSFGIVMQGFDQRNGNLVAIKIERPENEHLHSLDREVEILSRLQNIKGIPKLLYYGSYENYNTIVMELLQKDLSSLIKQRKKFSLKSILQITIQLITILEEIHKQGVLHRDLKPENIMLDDQNAIYLIDFGISKIFQRKNGGLIPFKEKVPFVGTARYASIAAHKGQELSRKDDVESLFYVMIFCLKGTLPWQNLRHIPDDQRTQKIGELKETTDPKVLFKDLPIEFIKIYEYLRKLTYNTEPDYKTIIKLLQQAAKHLNIILDNRYEWDQQNNYQDLVVNRFGSLQPEETQIKNYEKFQSNINNNIYQNTHSRPSQLQLPMMKLESNQTNNSNYGSGNYNNSIYNSVGIIYSLSNEEISEELQEPIPDEQESQIFINVQAFPDHLKKPHQQKSNNQSEEEFQFIEDNLLSDKYQKLNAQVTTNQQCHKK
ncbi:unnamed protein product [Paramecium primaurelia]|uniref:Casein kinase I n=1 Tax=Paramecium primaurelia TaxID=5886 RepID=A0A8S1K3F0_PARPR|nr:unnamed protein product [Paramecium primaurelia]